MDDRGTIDELSLQDARAVLLHLVNDSPETGTRAVDIARQMLREKQTTINLRNSVCVMTVLTAREYRDLCRKTVPIAEDRLDRWRLPRSLREEFVNFGEARIYATLRSLYGESTSDYDDWKCSFGFQFLLSIRRGEQESRYTLDLCDLKGTLDFYFRRVLAKREEFEQYPDRSILHEPFDDFPQEEMACFKTAFVSGLAERIESAGEHCSGAFARSQDYTKELYGFRNGRFFTDSFNAEDRNATDDDDDADYEDDYEERQARYEAARRELAEDSGIPFNLTRPDD